VGQGVPPAQVQVSIDMHPPQRVATGGFRPELAPVGNCNHNIISQLNSIMSSIGPTILLAALAYASAE
jgi:hypothetical protein